MKTYTGIALGHYSDARYHPFNEIDKEIEQIFEGKIQVESTDRYERLNTDSLSVCELFISYTEFIKEKPLPAEQVAALLSFVANGGGLLAIHNGISLQRNDELASMLGARFTGHPAFTSLSVQIRDYSHPIMHGINPFTIEDEPYRFSFSPLLQTTVLAEYEHEGKLWPAAWAHEFGRGRIVYLMPGHQLSSFKIEAYRKLILNSGLWAARII
ncbi:ThuA domain-containing protein [Paenibacillus sp. 2TAB23]|uniref:ThuA domain-containing protein n=1 Tax=Paenibacillus sp. 2TAB23 TaxID=3233004 RepID=UPI003F9B30CB